MYESYAIKGGVPITNRLAEWQPSNTNLIKGDLELVTSFIDRRSDLQGMALRHSWFEEPPYVTFITDDSGRVVNSMGFNAAIVAELQAQLNITRVGFCFHLTSDPPSAEPERREVLGGEGCSVELVCQVKGQSRHSVGNIQ